MDADLHNVERWLQSATVEDICPADASIFFYDKQDAIFSRLQSESPIHLCRQSPYGEYWSITNYSHIVEIENSPSLFSSADGFTLEDTEPNAPRSFMRMDPPEHQQTRRFMSSLSSRDKLGWLRTSVLEAITTLVDALPIGQPIDWVSDVSTKISRMVFCEVMGLPVSDGELFEKWAQTSMDAALKVEDNGVHFGATLNACAQYFKKASKGSADHRGHNLLSMLIQANAVNGRGDQDLIADIIILLIGGIETVKHAMTGSIILFNRFSSELVKLRRDSALLASAMSEVLRMQTPFPYMRRTASMDIDFHGVTFKKGSKIALWYLAANRDKDHFVDPHTFSISRENSGSHLSFGSGPHQCIGKHLALMELELLWRVLIERGLVVKQLAPARKINSSFVNGFASLTVELQRS